MTEETLTALVQVIATQLENNWTGQSETKWSFYLQRSDGLSLFACSNHADPPNILWAIKCSWGALSKWQMSFQEMAKLSKRCHCQS